MNEQSAAGLGAEAAQTDPDHRVQGESPAPETLAAWTTLRLGGRARRFVHARSTDALIEAVTEADARREPLLVLGAGSNLLVADEGFDGTVVRVGTEGIEVESDDLCSGVFLRAAAGTPWDRFVERAVTSAWSGVEALSGIPGSVGATPIQNVGAYGQEVAQTIASVRTWDREQSRVRTIAAAECDFGYRHSRFKAETFRGGPRFVVLEVTYQLTIADLSKPIAYAELAASLGVAVGARVALAEVREAVLALRRLKGMVLDPSDHDTWSSGSFFTNPVLSGAQADLLPDAAPRWPLSATQVAATQVAEGPPGQFVKTSAAWLIEHAGFDKGYGLPGPASLSTKHSLAVTNRGSAATADVLAIVRAVRAGVQDRFGVHLEPETVLVGCSL